MAGILYIHFMLGPLMLILAFLYKRFPPRKINHWYGYRTPRSMRSPEAWDCANRYSANAFVVTSCLTCLTQVITYSLMDGAQSIIWSAAFLTLTIIATIPLTEIHLKKRGFS